MQSLPDMMVLDFCEWLQKQVPSVKKKEVDVIDFILNEENTSDFLKYAKKFLSVKGSYSIRGLLHRFIDSKEFSECLRHFSHDYRNSNYPLLRIHPEDLRYIIYDCINSCEYGFERFLRHYESIDRERCFEGEISPNDLVFYMSVRRQIKAPTNCIPKSNYNYKPNNYLAINCI